MRYLLVLGVFSATTLTYAKDVVCPAGKSNSQVAVEAGDTIGYQTQAGATYEKNTNCVTKFTLDNSCKKIKFSCDSFNLGKGDLMIVKIGKKSKKFKGKKFKKPIVSTKTTLITFKSNKKKEGPGALCSMECIKSAATAAPTPPPTTVEDGVILVVAGDYYDISVEALNSNGTRLCDMPDLPDKRFVHSISGDMLCGGWYTLDSCLQYKSGSWIQYPWKLLYPRAHHLSWRSPSGKVFLFGGWFKQNITEYVTPSGSSEGFPLNDRSINVACSISFYDYVVISGGAGAPQSVNVFNENGWVKELPSHIEGRWYHGCGHYNNDEGKLVYLVVGGFEEKASTEILVDGSSSWKYGGNLPLRRRDIKTITLNNELFMMGGGYQGYIRDEIFKFNKSTEEWEIVDTLSKPRRAYGLTVLPREDVEPFCLA